MTMIDLIPWRRRKNNLSVRREHDVDDWFGSFHREMNQLMDRFFRGFDLGPMGWSDGLGTGDFMPRVDIRETDKALKVTAELPGLDEQDIELVLSKDNLTIKGEKREENEDHDGDVYRMERRYGSFHRVIPLSAEIDESKVEAKFKKGVLKINLPKTATAQQSRRKIDIKTV